MNLTKRVKTLAVAAVVGIPAAVVAGVIADMFSTVFGISSRSALIFALALFAAFLSVIDNTLTAYDG